LFDTRKKILMRKQKIIKKKFFALFLLQKVKFEEIRKNCLYIIIYKSLHIIIYEQFFKLFILFFNLRLIFCKRKAKVILLIIFYVYYYYYYYYLYQTVIL